jgi:hypothetical protein
LGLLFPLRLGGGGSDSAVIFTFSLGLLIFTLTRAITTLLRARRFRWYIHVEAIRAGVDPYVYVILDTIVGALFIVARGFSRRRRRKVAAAIVLLPNARAASLRRSWFVFFLTFTME